MSRSTSTGPMPAHRSTMAALGLAAIAGAAACGGWQAPAPPPVASIPVLPEPARAAPAAPKPSAFATLRDRIVDEWLADEPQRGRNAGLHEFDGKVADYSAAAVARRIARLEKARSELGAVDSKSLGADEALDRALLLTETELELFELVDLVEWKRRPQHYGELFEVDAYVNRDYAPIAERARRLLLHERAALAQVAHVAENVVGPLSKPNTETAVKVFRGYAEYLRGDLVKALAGVGDDAFKRDFPAVNADLAKAADAVADRLAKVEVPRGDNSHVLGKARYEKLLRVQEGFVAPLAELEKMGEDDLAANKKAFVELSKKTKLGRLDAKDLLPEATKLTEASRRFVIDKALVSIPGEAAAVVHETPPFMRWNSAFLDMPGPLDTAKEGFYYITMPDPKWPKKEQDDYVMPRGILLSTTIHEVYPGHFLQGQWRRRAPTRVQKVFGSYSFVEGWAHYGEQMMIEQGFGGDDPQSRLGQLSDALLRNCRVVVSIGIHTKGMSLDEAARRFRDDCFQDKATAREQAVRGTFDPGYFAYTLGKLQILALRDEARKRLGDRFSLRAFHDALLSHGSPPVPLIRERVLADLAASAK